MLPLRPRVPWRDDDEVNAEAKRGGPSGQAPSRGARGGSRCLLGERVCIAASRACAYVPAAGTCIAGRRHIK